jgi:hypothetical protein
MLNKVISMLVKHLYMHLDVKCVKVLNTPALYNLYKHSSLLEWDVLGH